MSQEQMNIYCRRESIKDRIKALQENAAKRDLLTKGQSQLDRLQKDNPNYGRPIEGSKTAKRGHIAHERVAEEVKVLCQVIKDYGKYCPADGTYFIFFGELFQIYTRISDKVVGMLLRARKYGFVEFLGEMLYQGRDDWMPVRLLRMPDKDWKMDY